MGAQSIYALARFQDGETVITCERTNVPMDTIRGYRVAIDGHSWIHPLIHTYQQLHHGTGLGLTSWVVDMIRGRIVKLAAVGCSVTLVMDRFENGMKSRERNQDTASKITAIRMQLFQQLPKLGVVCFKALVEADHQIAWFIQAGHIDAVVAKDGDFLIYGASCDKSVMLITDINWASHTFTT